MKIKLVADFKNKFVFAVIAVGAIMLAVPIFIFGLVRIVWSVLWSDFTSWARPRKPVVAKTMRRWAETTEARIVDLK